MKLSQVDDKRKFDAVWSYMQLKMQMHEQVVYSTLSWFEIIAEYAISRKMAIVRQTLKYGRHKE